MYVHCICPILMCVVCVCVCVCVTCFSNEWMQQKKEKKERSVCVCVYCNEWIEQKKEKKERSVCVCVCVYCTANEWIEQKKERCVCVYMDHLNTWASVCSPQCLSPSHVTAAMVKWLEWIGGWVVYLLPGNKPVMWQLCQGGLDGIWIYSGKKHQSTLMASVCIFTH